MPNETPPALTPISESLFEGEGGSGYVIAGGEIVAHTGTLPADGAWVDAMTAISRDADRAARHLGFSGWDAVVIESGKGTIGVAPADRPGSLAVAACPAGSPPGYVRRVLGKLVSAAGPESGGGVGTGREDRVAYPWKR